MKTSLLVSLLLFTLPGLGQVQDSVRVETTTTVDSSANRPLTKTRQNNISKFWQAYRAERTLVKVGFFGIPILFSRYELGVEQKLYPAWSVGASFWTFHSSLFSINQTNIYGSVFGRWYYSMNKRIREQRGANNFVGTYLTVRLNSPQHFAARAKNLAIDTLFSKTTRVGPSIDLGWGVQKRLGRWGYVDLSPGFTYSFTNPVVFGRTRNRLGLRLSIIFGLGF